MLQGSARHASSVTTAGLISGHRRAQPRGHLRLHQRRANPVSTAPPAPAPPPRVSCDECEPDGHRSKKNKSRDGSTPALEHPQQLAAPPPAEPPQQPAAPPPAAPPPPPLAPPPPPAAPPPAAPPRPPAAQPPIVRPIKPGCDNEEALRIVAIFKPALVLQSLRRSSHASATGLAALSKAWASCTMTREQALLVLQVDEASVSKRTIVQRACVRKQAKVHPDRDDSLCARYAWDYVQKAKEVLLGSR